MKEIKEQVDKYTLLVEYQTAQASAQHSDDLIWTVTGIIWSGMLVLFGFVLGNLYNTNLTPILTLLSVLGITLTIAVWMIALQLNRVVRQKYQRCKIIEEQLGMHQHKDLKYVQRFQRIIYGIITALFIISWLIILLMAWEIV